MLMPKKTKYRKLQRGRLRGRATKGVEISFGDFGLQASETGYITDRQIEAARRAITHCIKRSGKIWIRIFPDKSVTRLPAETRMGKGKGSPEFWSAPVKRGRVLFELSGVEVSVAREALRLAAFKLPLKTRFRTKEELMNV